MKNAQNGEQLTGLENKFHTLLSNKRISFLEAMSKTFPLDYTAHHF